MSESFVKDDSDAGQLAGTFLVLEREERKHVPAERLSMRKIKEVLRLKFEVGLANRQIARSCCDQPQYGRRLLAPRQGGGAGCLAVAEIWTKRSWKRDCFRAVQQRSDQPGRRRTGRPFMRNCTATSTSRCSCFGRNTSSPNPDGYQYSRFCELYQRGLASWIWFCGRNTAPEKSCLSIMPATPFRSSIRRPARFTKASIFVAVLGASNYTYAEATWNQDLASWIRSHVRALEFFGRRDRPCLFPTIARPRFSIPAGMNRI